MEGESSTWRPPPIRPQPWSGLPADWQPGWGSDSVSAMTDTAWACLDKNASVLASMPPYLVGAAPSLDDAWLDNPDPDLYTAWPEFAKQMFWDYQLGEVFVLATARYASGYPARFHVVPPWAVNVEWYGGRRRYTIGSVDVSPDMLHVRYQGTVTDAHGHGPLEAGYLRVVASDVLTRYATGLASSGGVPSSVLEHPDELTADQSAALQAQWVAARSSRLGEPAVLSGGVTWKATQVNPTEMALQDLQTFNESRIAILLGVPPFLMGLPSGGDSMTYTNGNAIRIDHWESGLKPKAEAVMSALSEWLLPRGTAVELNRDEYVRPDPYTRAQTEAIYLANGVLSIDEVRAYERFNSQGVMQ